MTKLARAAFAFACLSPLVLFTANAQDAQTKPAPIVPSAPSTDPVIQSIINEGKNKSQVMDILRYIAVNVGPRCTGSPELERGEKWAVGKFKSFGCQDVHREKW